MFDQSGKAVQSVWFKDNFPETDYACGWLSSAFHLMSWALSAYQLSRFFPRVELMTDTVGAELADKLVLPYTHIQTDLETQKQQNFLWVSNKLYTYSVQQEPFIHIDTDAYFFSQIPAHLLTAPLVAQNFEYDHQNYVQAYQEVQTHFLYRPSLIAKDYRGRLTAANAGVMGGTNVQFFEEFYGFVAGFLQQNEANLSKCRYDFLNEFVEQFLFTQFANAKNIPVSYVLPTEFGPPCNYQIAEFSKLPTACNYIHILNYKRNSTVCEQMAQRLWLEAPDLYERVLTVCRKLDATHHPVSLPATISHQLPPFYRTQYLLHTLGLADAALPLTETELANIIAAMPQTTPHDVLTDVFAFETRRQEFVDSLPEPAIRWQGWQRYSRQTNTLLSQPADQYTQAVIQQSPRCVRLESEWDWAEVNEFADQTANRDLATNLTAEPAYFEVLLYYYPHQQLVREQLLDALNMLILDALDAPATINNVLAEVVAQVQQYQPQTDVEQLRETVLGRIRHFLYHGIICA